MCHSERSEESALLGSRGSSARSAFDRGGADPSPSHLRNEVAYGNHASARDDTFLGACEGSMLSETVLSAPSA